jgi:RHS repeat-associated protein
MACRDTAMTIEKGHTMKISQCVIRSLCLLGLWLGLGLQVHAQTDTVTYIYTDPQGTPLVKADASGNVIARYDYTPYGNSVASLGSPPNGPGYTGHVNDPETGWVYMQARYYDPRAHFLSPDPVGPTPGNVFSFNRYAYANNNPIRNTDPDGRQSVGEMIDSGAEGCGPASCAGWAVLSAAWTLTGAEPVSQVADKGIGAGAGTVVMAAVTVATLGKGGETVTVGKEVVQGAEDVAKSISGISGHAVDQAINRGVKPTGILDAVKNPLKQGEVKVDSLGRPSQASVGAKATVIVNPETRKIITTYPTSSKKADRLLQGN